MAKYCFCEFKAWSMFYLCHYWYVLFQMNQCCVSVWRNLYIKYLPMPLSLMSATVPVSWYYLRFLCCDAANALTCTLHKGQDIEGITTMELYRSPSNYIVKPGLNIALSVIKSPQSVWLYVFSSFPLPPPPQRLLLLMLKAFELNLRYLGQRKYRSGKMYLLVTFIQGHGCDIDKQKFACLQDKVRITQLITTKLGSYIPLVMLITWWGQTLYWTYLRNGLGWVGLWGFLWWAPLAKRKDHHGVSSGWSSVWHCSNSGLSSSQYEQISIILGVWPFCLTPIFFRSITFWRAYGWIIFPLMKLLSFFWLTYYCSIGLCFSVRV